MNVNELLSQLNARGAIAELLTPAPAVSPGAIIAADMAWNGAFTEARKLYQQTRFEEARIAFHDLNESLPAHDRLLTPAKINETFCWLNLGMLEDYISYYQPMVADGRAYGSVAWNYAVAQYRAGKAEAAVAGLRRWIASAPPQMNTVPALLAIALIETQLGITNSAAETFAEAVARDAERCYHCISTLLNGVDLSVAISTRTATTPSRLNTTNVPAAEAAITALRAVLVPRAPEKYPQLRHQMSEFEYQAGYVAALERFGDADVDDALRLLESLTSGNNTRPPLTWAKSACLMAKREWSRALLLIEPFLGEAGTPGGVHWNATCAYFHLARYDSAFQAITRCVETEFRSSGPAWLVRALLAHLAGKHDIRNASISQAAEVSPKQLAYHIDLLRQLGADLGGFNFAVGAAETSSPQDELSERYTQIAKEAQDLLECGKPLQAARLFVSMAPEAISSLPEATDAIFNPVILATCPAALYDHRDLFIAGVNAYQRKAYEESVRKFEDLYQRTNHAYAACVNLGASLILSDRYSRATDVLIEAVSASTERTAYALRNLIAAYVRTSRLDEALPVFHQLLRHSSKEYFNYVEFAVIASRIGRKEDVASALFSACTESLSEPSNALKAAAIAACLDVGDDARAIALARCFVNETPLPYVVAGKIRPRRPAKRCTGFSQMQIQYAQFEKRNDTRAAVDYFHEVYVARESDYSASGDLAAVDGLFNACMYYGRSLFNAQEFDRANDILRQAFGLLVDHGSLYDPKELSKRYYALTNVYVQRRHYFWAQELCTRGLDADPENPRLLVLKEDIGGRIAQIPEISRSAIQALSELGISELESNDELVSVLPKVRDLIGLLPRDFPECRGLVDPLVGAIHSRETIGELPVQSRKRELVRLLEVSAQIERDLPIHLPREFVSTLLPILKRLKSSADELLRDIVLPEFTLSLEGVSYYRESDASLLYRVRNVGRADVKNLRLRIRTGGSGVSQAWDPVIEEKLLDDLKKDESLWIDWPIHLNVLLSAEEILRPVAVATYTGGSLRGESAEAVFDNHETRLIPFVDVTVDYPVVALRPEEGSRLPGRETLLRTLKNSFGRASQSRIPFLEGVRKVGKTSILYFLEGRLEDKGLVVYVNLDTSWENPYQLFASRITNKLLMSGAALSESAVVASREGFEQFIARLITECMVSHIILLLDEFHAVIERITAGLLPSEFLGDLRYLCMGPGQRVSLAFADWHMIDEMRGRVPAQIWTDLAREPISFLNELDSRDAILIPSDESGARYERDAVSRIYYWTNGYPWHIQWICSELMNHLNTQKRYVVIPQDVDLMAERLLREDRLFNEGVCRPERLTRDSQTLIWDTIEALVKERVDIRGWFPRSSASDLRFSFDGKREIARLVHLEVLQEQGDLLRFSSPLHAMWLESRRRRGLDVHGEGTLASTIGGHIQVPPDPAAAVVSWANGLRILKGRLREALIGKQQVYQNVDLPSEWTALSVMVVNNALWDAFIKAAQRLFVEDMHSRLDSWGDRRVYSKLCEVLYLIRNRRNYVEHPDSHDARIVEERCRREDIGANAPTSEEDWLRLQIGLLLRIQGAIEDAVRTAATSRFEQ